jgi:hypothetical protein
MNLGLKLRFGRYRFSQPVSLPVTRADVTVNDTLASSNVLASEVQGFAGLFDALDMRLTAVGV